ncbi:hypothetical protein U2G91_21130 [Rhodococcoides fascians]|uniref:hypothetical protein n=1 Tax=Rhodococcoides fascians TaxID=1828 RepID=UPI002ACDF311|nr:hypothetical protein [Rhodococcus fascians]WQH27541.1 hypothetical protein U2G91_21130 [Rhodococcus fascians]
MLYLLTNRMNLYGVLGSRVVAPRESYGKYYSDLLERAPGWVPLITDRPSAALIELVTAERGAGGPVLVELTPDGVEGLRHDGAVVYVSAVALSRAVAIHLHNERELREHRARVYSNIHPHAGLLRASPDLFAGGPFSMAEPEPPTQERTFNWRRIDRIRGAMNAVLASVQSGEQLAIVARFLGASRPPTEFLLPEWVSATEIDDHEQSDLRDAPNTDSPDSALFRAAYSVLGDQDAAETWSPNAVLDAVTSTVLGLGLTEQAIGKIARNLNRVRAIVNVEADFEPFRPTAQALVSAQAILLVLLRPDLQQLLSWPATETGADELTRTTAALLAGRLRGLTREATEVRSVQFDDITADWAVRAAQGQPGPIGNVQLTIDSHKTRLSLNGVELATAGPLKQNQLLD